MTERNEREGYNHLSLGEHIGEALSEHQLTSANGDHFNLNEEGNTQVSQLLGGAFDSHGKTSKKLIESVDRTARHYVQNVFDHITGICAEKNVTDMIDIVTDEPNKKQYNIYYTADKVVTTPHLMIKWQEGRFSNIVKIYMNQHVKPFRKQIKIDKPEKYDAIINTAIDTLVAQNELYNETKAMIENCVSEFNLDVEPEYIRRTRTLWHVSYKKGTLPHSIVIQYDERSKEFLFQKRYITSDDVVDLVNAPSRTI